MFIFIIFTVCNNSKFVFLASFTITHWQYARLCIKRCLQYLRSKVQLIIFEYLKNHFQSKFHFHREFFSVEHFTCTRMVTFTQVCKLNKYHKKIFSWYMATSNIRIKKNQKIKNKNWRNLFLILQHVGWLAYIMTVSFSIYCSGLRKTSVCDK